MTRPRVLVGLGSLLLALVVVTLVLSGEDPDEAAPEETADAAPTETVPPDHGTDPPELEGPIPPEIDPALMLGSEDAPVTMVVFGDYQCPNCAIFAEEHQPALIERYVETGDLLLVWRDYPYLGDESDAAAVAARAAARQDAFWPYQDALYASPDTWGSDPEAFVAIAADLDLDTERFAEDLEDPDLQQAVDDDFAFALGLSVPGTPAFLINGEAYFGVQPLEEFQAWIEEAKE
ncbi:thioredoxin domain-containing protein [Spiractinospora alimapuensis]|nr:thioredoxin domain-containing protein [Spiractinospora alimapuensis]